MEEASSTTRKQGTNDQDIHVRPRNVRIISVERLVEERWGWPNKRAAVEVEGEGKGDGMREGEKAMLSWIPPAARMAPRESNASNWVFVRTRACVVKRQTRLISNIYTSKQDSSGFNPNVPCNANALIVNDTGRNPTKLHNCAVATTRLPHLPSPPIATDPSSGRF